MKKGFPRPRFTHTDDKTYPHPYSASDHTLAAIDFDRQAECMEQLRCGVCGEPLGDTVWVFKHLYKGGSVVVDNVAMHKRCADITNKVCPHMSSGKAIMKSITLSWYRRRYAKE